VTTAREEIVSGKLKVSAIGDADGTHKRLQELFPKWSS